MKICDICGSKLAKSMKKEYESMQQCSQEKQQGNRKQSVQEEQQGTRKNIRKKSSKKLVNNVNNNVQSNQGRMRATKYLWNTQGIIEKSSKELVKKVCK